MTQGAKRDLVTAYNDAAGRSPVTNVPVELGGRTLLAGVYKSPSLGLTGTLTLDAKGSPDAQFIFKAGSTLITESNSRVLLLNGADPCRVVWQVGSSATFKTGTRFVGDVLAHTSITAQTAATFRGRLLASNGAVTLDTNTITKASCAAPASGGGTGSGGTGFGGTGSGGTGPGVTGSGGTGSGGTGSGGSGSTTVGETTVNGASARYPSAAPGSVSPGAGSASLTGTPGLSNGAPGELSRGALSTYSTLAATGGQVVGLMGTGLALLALGAVALLAGRRSRKAQVA